MVLINQGSGFFSTFTQEGFIVSQQPNATWEQVREEMTRLQVTGFSSMSSFTPNEHMGHLACIERIIESRRTAAQQKRR